jgi:pheromone a factor receptor
MNSDTADGSYPKSGHAIALPILTLLAIILLIGPWICHWRHRNIGACSLIFYLNLANFFTFVNVIIWPTENFDSWWDGVGLCDIEAKLKWPYVTGLACASLCVTRSLANVLDVERVEVSSTRASRRRKMLVDIAICFTVPFLQLILHYIIQYNRYYITAIGGCTPSYDNSWPTIVIMYIWPLLFCLVDCYYAGT